MKRYCSLLKLVSIALCLLLQPGCKQSAHTATSSAYFKQIEDSINASADPHSTRAHFLLDSLFHTNPAADPAARFSYYMQYCGYYHVNIKDDKKALVYADSMVWVVHNNPGIAEYDKKDAYANISKGDALFGLKRYNEAYQFYYLGKLAAEKTLDPCTYSEYSYRLGMVMYKKATYPDAAFYFKQAFFESAACPESFGVFYRRQELLNNTALGYKKSGQNDSALIYYNKALDFLNVNEAKYSANKRMFGIARGVVYGNMGQIYATGNTAKAEQLYKQSIEINSRPGGDINDALVTQQHLANLYFEQNNFEAMHNVLLSIKKGLDTIKNESVSIGWNRLMWKYYDNKNDVTNAYQYLGAYNNLKEAEAESNKTLNESDVTSEMKSLEAEYQVNLLRRDNKLKQAYFIIAAALTILLVIIMLLILNNWRKSKKNILALTALNNKINSQKTQLENTLSQLEERNREKDRILGIVAHDLRNPIAAISSLITLMEDGHNYNQEQEKMLSLMQNACTNSIELINEILEFAIDEENSNELVLEPVDINLIAANCVRLLSFKAAEKKQRIELQLSGSAEIIQANPVKIWRIISNLLTNAVKFSPSGATVQVATKHSNGNVQLSVHDNGIGIPDDIKDKVFDTHTKAKRPGTQGEKPFGLGLSICKQIVESYDGKIWFETVIGKGTTFYISLPGNAPYDFPASNAN